MNGDYQSLAPELKENLKMLAENRLCQTPEEVRELLEVNDKGQVKNTMQNVYQVFQSIRYCMEPSATTSSQDALTSASPCGGSAPPLP